MNISCGNTPRLRLIWTLSAPALSAAAVIAGLQSPRRCALGRALMEEALFLCHRHCPRQDIALPDQAHLVPFYTRRGFVAISDTCRDYGIQHVDMRLRRT